MYYCGKYQFRSQIKGRPRLKWEAKKKTEEPPRFSRTKTEYAQDHASPKAPEVMSGFFFSKVPEGSDRLPGIPQENT